MENTMEDSILNRAEQAANQARQVVIEQALRPYVPEQYMITIESNIGDTLTIIVHTHAQWVRIDMVKDMKYSISAIDVEFAKLKKRTSCHIDEPYLVFSTLEQIAPRLKQALQYLDNGDPEQAGQYLAGFAN